MAQSSSGETGSTNKSVHRIGKTLRGYDRKAVDLLLDRKENELADLQSELAQQKVLLTEAESERMAFMRSLEVAARAADELLDEATRDAENIRNQAQIEAAEAVRAAEESAKHTQVSASSAAAEIVAVAKADIAGYEDLERQRIDAVSAASTEMAMKVEADKEALSRYQNELSSYLYQLGQYLMSASIDPTIALPIDEQPALIALVPDDQTIVLADHEAEEENFDEFFSDDIEQDKSRDWILKEAKK